jgi:hypothetical protein
MAEFVYNFYQLRRRRIFDRKTFCLNVPHRDFFFSRIALNSARDIFSFPG